MLKFFSALRDVVITLSVLVSLSHAFAITNTADLKEVGIDEKLAEPLPLELTFYDEEGKQVRLGDFFNEGKPVILALVYYSCPRVCSFILDGVKNSINDLSSLSLGNDFKIIAVSFNPDDSPGLAREKAVSYYDGLRNDHFPKGNWHFLTGDEENIRQLTQSVGFRYKKDGKEFAHPMAITVLTPDGKISRYLYGVQFEPKDLKLALIEASNGEIGSSRLVNKVMLFCYEFDPVGKKYALKALNVVKAGGVLTLLSLTVFLTYMWKREKK